LNDGNVVVVEHPGVVPEVDGELFVDVHEQHGVRVLEKGSVDDAPDVLVALL